MIKYSGRQIIYGLLIATLLIGNFRILAQESVPNLKTIDINEFNDEQIRRFIQQMEASGYTEAQLETLARARGMTSSNIQALRNRIRNIKENPESVESISNISRSRATEIIDFDLFQEINEEKQTRSDGLPIFGQSFFANTQVFEPSLNVPTPTDYLLGAGDELVIDIWGASEQSYQLTISPEGSILIPSVGPVFLNGYSITEAESRIKNRLKSIYSTLGENTFAQVSLGKLKTITVNVVGEVVRPGSYPLSSFANLLTVLTSAGGPSERGSFRTILIYRNGKQIASQDLYDFLVNGGVTSFRLQDQDIVMVPAYQQRVTILGEVKRPAIYEAKEGETLGDLIHFAGGFSEKAYYKTVSLRRNLDNRRTVETVRKDQLNQLILKSGDEVIVDPIRELFVERVVLEGAVNHPGEYKLVDGMMLSDLIDQADGFSPDVYKYRGLILRQNKDFTFTTIAFAPVQLMEGSWDIPLISEDVVKIQSIFDLQESLTVSIQGEVIEPKTVAYSDSMTVEDLIFLAKGFKETASKSSVEVARRIVDPKSGDKMMSELYNFPIDKELRLSENDASFVLNPFDLVVIRRSPYYKKQQVVELEGEIIFPGKYVLNTKTERISDLINRAGGLTSDAFPAGGTLIRQTEYYDDSKAALVKKLRIQSLEQYDSTALEGTFEINREESIAIELDKIIDKPGSVADLIMKDGDILSVPKILQTIRIRGEVYFPSNLVYTDRLDFKDLLSQAGGSTENAWLKKSYIVYPNGSAKRTRSFLGIKAYPNLLPGSEVIIPRKPARQDMSLQAALAMTSGVATSALVILRLIDYIKPQ